MTNTISLCMIVKNEEKVLERCLQSVEKYVNEIIIVDTGSTDLTREIARKYTDKIYSFEWVNDFSAARNESLRYANSDYVLVLDADEYLEFGEQLKEDLITKLDYYVVNIKNTTNQGTAFHHTAVRLFKNHLNLYYENRLHEHLNIVDTSQKYSSGISNCLITHSGYSDLITLEEKKVNRNLPLMELEVKENPTAYNLFNMGKTYFGMSMFSKAVEYFRRSFPLSKNRAYLPELLTKLAFALAESGKSDEALTILKDATPLYPTETEMKYIQGTIYKKAGYYKDAEACFLHCLVLGDQGTAVTEGSGSFMAHLQLSELQEMDGNFDECYKHKLKAIEIKGSAAVFHNYLEFSLTINQPLEQVKNNIEKYFKIEEQHGLQHLMDILYGLRHPLLHFYLNKFKITVQPHITVVSKIYNKQYQTAYELLIANDSNDTDIGLDILLLSYILKSDHMLSEIQSMMNLGNKEVKNIKQLLNHQDINGNVSSSVDKILLELCRKLIILEEFELFQKLIEKLIRNDMKYKISISKILSEFKFDELAIDFLTEIYKSYPNNIEIMHMLGNLCFRNGYVEDAQLFYSKLITMDASYVAYERSLRLFKCKNEVRSIELMEKEIIKKFPILF